MRIVLLFLSLFAFSTAYAGETVVSELSQGGVSITANFDGSEVFIFGAIKHDGPMIETNGQLDVIIEVSGPTIDALVRRKERKLGVWINTDAVELERAPSFYTIAATAPIEDLLSESERSLRNLGLDFAVRVYDENDEEYREAVIRINQDNGKYKTAVTPVTLTEETLFTTILTMPSNVIEGDYIVKTLLVRDLAVISTSTSIITVSKTGMERFLYTMAHERPFLYGILSLAVALFAGWGASEIFRRIRA